MSWQQQSIEKIDHQRIPCRLTTNGFSCNGWIMPNGFGVFQQDGVVVEFEPESGRHQPAQRYLAPFKHHEADPVVCFETLPGTAGGPAGRSVTAKTLLSATREPISSSEFIFLCSGSRNVWRGQVSWSDA